MNHAETALSIGDVLAANRADAITHPTIHKSPDARHRRKIVHTRAENEFRLLGREGRGRETFDLFRSMLPIGVEDDYKIDIALQNVTQPGLDRLAFAAVLFVNDYFRAGFARVVRGFVDRSVIDNEHVAELLARAPNHLANVLLLVVSGYDRRDLGHYQRTTG